MTATPSPDAPTEPSKEALEAAYAINLCRTLALCCPAGDKLGSITMDHQQASKNIALALDRFRAAGVREERERCNPEGI